ncbi:hypothetical protein DERP_005202 [Dermatophagoides pteronyssinus]|uniref:Knottins-like domain-containing protein n=1 Tax=Dermatophagoides pteronyssinus TaxID=6956 RepID=A0ABQ8JLY4_DERPT|nr:hypothetical protein DERP_005202 [Dermatophagoides pteronyssinus]
MMILEPTMANPIPEIQLADSPVADSFDCPLTSLCRKHCQENGFKDGVCQGLLNKDCRCIGHYFYSI